MDSSKRQFLQQLGVLTAGASLVPLAEAKFPFSPERHEGSPRHRYAMLIDLRRCIGCQSCTVSCTIENQTPQGAFRTTVNQYQSSVKVVRKSRMCYCRVCATIAIPPACRSARYKPPFSGKTALWWWITNAASAAPIVSRRVLTTPDLSIMKRKLPINARFAFIVWKPDCYPLA